MKTGILRAIIMAFMIMVSTVFSPLASKAELKENNVETAKIDKYMESVMNRLHIPGAAVGIVKGDQMIYLKGYGISGPDKTPVTPQTSFVIGSTSKSFTALAVMQLVEEGKIDLNAPILRYLPWFEVANKEASMKILVKDLLYQTSGFSTHDGVVGIVKGNMSIEEYIRSLKSTSLADPVGSRFQYSNVNYNILGAIVETVSGEPFPQYMSNHIFKPLDMNHSYASTDEAEQQSKATGYQPVFGFMVPTQQLNHQATVASGYLLSSAEDMSKYVIAQMNGGSFDNKSILSEKGIEQLHRPSASMGNGASYAMGWTVKNDVIFHDGKTENTYSFMVINGDYGIVLLTNAQDSLVSYDSVIMGIHGILMGEEPSLDDIPDFNQTYLIVNLAVLVVLAIVAWSIYSVFTWRTNCKATTFGISLHSLFILFFHLLIPLTILFYLPKILISPWSAIMLFLPGLGHFLICISILLLFMGVIKTFLIIRSARFMKHTRKQVRHIS
ncbi:serine hydrolase domain-containing protein [Brevibacillus choshinensis]|uniref:serine hydrolase domain-containing protein n=1 Tax=Brevibacillus choshinensis TaxID=54911 RepID=UPI002E1A2864|nr:serine hydrolase [Brevibacillus choshinensis]